MVFSRTQMLLFSMISVMSSSLLSPRISSIGVLPTPRSSGRSLAVTPTNSDDSNIDAVEPALATRRAILGGAAATGSLILGGAPERAAAVGWDFDTSSEPLPANRRITSKLTSMVPRHQVRVAFRIAETQATTSTREGLPQEDFEMVFGLYGQAAPQITENFLRYCASPTADSASVTTASGGAASSSSSSSWGKPDLNLPSRNGATGSELSQEDDQGVVQPRLDKGQLWRLEPGVLLEGGKIKGLKEVSNGAAFSYGTKLYPNGMFTETNVLPHNARGLLTRRLADLGPTFEITLAAAPELDGISTVFGEILEGADYLYVLENIPVYTYSAAPGSGSVADNVFKAQKEAYTGMAKQLKDQRFEDLRGKLLRRVDIRSVTIL